MRLLVCDCGSHEFVVFTGMWSPTAPNEMAARIYGACTGCGKAWDLETALWVDKPLDGVEHR